MNAPPEAFTLALPRQPFLAFLREMRTATSNGYEVIFATKPGRLWIYSFGGDGSFEIGDVPEVSCRVSAVQLRRLVSAEWRTRLKPGPFRLRFVPAESLLSFEHAGVKVRYF